MLVTRGQDYPLGLAERVVYSHLAFRGRLDAGDSIRGIAAATTLDARTAKRCLHALGGLVVNKGGRWVAVEPSGDQAKWFAPRKAQHVKHWSDTLASFKLFLPSQGAKVDGHRFSLGAAAVYSVLQSLGRSKNNRVQGTSATHLSRLLSGLDEGAIRTGLDLLQQAGLIQITRTGRRMNVIVTPIAEVHGELFAKADDVPAKAPAAGLGKLEFSDTLYESIYTTCLDKGIPATLAIAITKVSGKFPDLYYDDFLRISNIAEREHYRNCMAGRFGAPDGDLPHHGRLLLHKLRERLKLHQKQLQAHPSCAYPTWEELTRREEAAAEARRLEEEIRANPLHEKRDDIFREPDVQARVQVDKREANKLLHAIFLRIEPYEFQEATLDHFYNSVVGHSLNRINHYYGKTPKATVAEFQQAVNAVLAERGIKPAFPS